MWGTDATSAWTTREGLVTIFVAVDHCTAEGVGIHAAKIGNRFEALEPIRQGVRARFGVCGPEAARELKLRHDHGSQYISDAFQDELAFLGIESSPAFVRAPEGNGCAERLIRTLMEQLLWIRSFETVELRLALHALARRRHRPGKQIATDLYRERWPCRWISFYGRRSLKLFAWWPLALRPDARRALLVSYGIGNTAEALARAPGLARIDVVDISRIVLGLSPLIARAGAPDPLLDPRVRVRVEDGRFHLLAGTGTYDLITAEPPPPRGAGVVSLYTLEYFRLVRGRLAPGGVATHWLPVNQLSVSDSWAIVRAFCSVFEDCSLWSGAGYDWMLAGTNGIRPPYGEGFARPWRDASPDLRDIGVETPEDLGALFIADAATLDDWTAGVPPLVDDRPGRLRPWAPPDSDRAVYRELREASSCAERFRASAFVRRLWPPELRERTLASFEWRGVFDRDYDDVTRPEAIAELWATLGRSSLRTLPLLLVDSEPRLTAIARARHAEGERHPVLAFHLGAAALADRDYASAARFFEEAGSASVGYQSPVLLRSLALGLAGRAGEALALAESSSPAGLPPHALPWRAWLIERLRSAADGARLGRPAIRP